MLHVPGLLTIATSIVIVSSLLLLYLPASLSPLLLLFHLPKSLMLLRLPTTSLLLFHLSTWLLLFHLPIHYTRWKQLWERIYDLGVSNSEGSTSKKLISIICSLQTCHNLILMLNYYLHINWCFIYFLLFQSEKIHIITGT